MIELCRDCRWFRSIDTMFGRVEECHSPLVCEPNYVRGGVYVVDPHAARRDERLCGSSAKGFQSRVREIYDPRSWWRRLVQAVSQ